jgi:DNA-directed RNA polymerase subunit RPC12/RpoP
MKKNTCIRCGNELKKGTYVCPKCMINRTTLNPDGDKVKDAENIVVNKLILCSECNKEISKSAPVCPHCGFVRFIQPVDYSKNIQKETQLVELTSKSLKAEGCLTLVAFVISFTIMITGTILFQSSIMNIIGWIGMLLSGIWMIANSVKTWWYHG